MGESSLKQNAKELKFFDWSLDEVMHFIFAMRKKKKLNKIDNTIFQKLQEIGKQEKKEKKLINNKSHNK